MNADATKRVMPREVGDINLADQAAAARREARVQALAERMYVSLFANSAMSECDNTDDEIITHIFEAAEAFVKACEERSK